MALSMGVPFQRLKPTPIFCFSVPTNFQWCDDIGFRGCTEGHTTSLLGPGLQTQSAKENHPQEPRTVVGRPNHQVAGLLYTETVAGAFTWQWPEGSEDAPTARGPKIVESSMCGFMNSAETSQTDTRLLLGCWLQRHLSLLEAPSG